MQQLDAEFNGVSNILKTWFEKYKGPGKMQALGFEDADKAIEIIDESIGAFDALKN